MYSVQPPTKNRRARASIWHDASGGIELGPEGPGGLSDRQLSSSLMIRDSQSEVLLLLRPPRNNSLRVLNYESDNEGG